MNQRQPTRQPFRHGPWVAGLLLGATLGISVWAQTPPLTPPAATQSTSAGVYTAAQAARGEQVYGNVCQGCHTLSSHNNPKFRELWNGRPVADLFSLISETMPEDDPGSLAPAEYAQLLAFLLKANRVPEGKVELPGDVESLKRILIEFTPSFYPED